MGFQFSVWLHIVAACVWVGGMFFLALVVVPVVRGLPDRALATRLFHEVGTRFRHVGWATLTVLVVTGLTNLHYRGIGLDRMTDGEFWAGGYGRPLAYKLVLVLAILALSLFHDFHMGPRAVAVMRDQPGSREALRMRRMASIFGRVNLLAALAVIALAVVLVRGW